MAAPRLGDALWVLAIGGSLSASCAVPEYSTDLGYRPTTGGAKGAVAGETGPGASGEAAGSTAQDGNEGPNSNGGDVNEGGAPNVDSVATGGEPMIDSPTGGTSTSGGATGGAASGGRAGGGTSTGGMATGGASTGGAGTGGKATGGIPGTSEGPPVTGITVNDGYGQGFGFQGYWFTYTDNADGGTSTVTPECPPCFATAGSSICISGVGAMVTDENGFSINWGVGLGWNLDQALEEPNDPVPADLSAYSTVTVGLEVNTVATYRVRLDFGDASNYCVASVTNGSNTLDLRTDFVDECWAGGAATPLDPSLLSSVVALHIQVPTWLDTETPYDFCVTEVSFQ